MKLIGKMGLWLSTVAEQKLREGKFLLSARLYCLATKAVRCDMGLLKELAKRLEEK